MGEQRAGIHEALQRERRPVHAFRHRTDATRRSRRSAVSASCSRTTSSAASTRGFRSRCRCRRRHGLRPLLHGDAQGRAGSGFCEAVHRLGVHAGVGRAPRGVRIFDVPTNPKAKVHPLVKPYQSAKLINFDFKWAGDTTRAPEARRTLHQRAYSRDARYVTACRAAGRAPVADGARRALSGQLRCWSRYSSRIRCWTSRARRRSSTGACRRAAVPTGRRRARPPGRVEHVRLGATVAVLGTTLRCSTPTR